jgi:hypothetical protein
MLERGISSLQAFLNLCVVDQAGDLGSLPAESLAALA